MNYQQTLDFLYSQLPMYQRQGAAAYRASLDNTLALDAWFGHPHRKFRSIHIAGTNGKGSVAHMLAAVLHSAGYKTGLYTSPHLKDFRERIRIDGVAVPEEHVVGFVEDHRQIIDKIKPSFFEMTVAMAFDYFAMEQVEVAIIETGMGGRLDATNIIDPVVSVITNIGLDHTRFLGQTMKEIAGEKAAIIKHGVPVVIGERQEEIEPIFLSRAAEMNAPVSFADEEFYIGYSLKTLDQKQSFNIYREDEIAYENLEIDQMGFYQRKNTVTALQTLEKLRVAGIEVPREAIFSGLEDISRLTGLRGRWEILDYRPLVVCDTAHNAEALSHAADQILQTPWKHLHIVFGLVEDKNPEDLLRILPDNAFYYITQANIPRAMDRFGLFEKVERLGFQCAVFDNPRIALQEAKARAGQDDMIFIGGSTFVVAEII
jgi:dihydrofolate synthase/folylpolyglutamate synthase